MNNMTDLMGNARVSEAVSDLIKNLREFIHKHHITHPEYRQVVDFLQETAKQSEIPLLMDVFFESTVIDATYQGRKGTENTVEGPYYVLGSPMLKPPYALPQRNDESGDVLFFFGSVRATDGTPLGGALVDMWQADAFGRYSHFNYTDVPFNLRGRFLTDSNGRFEVRTVVPSPYEIPKFGPTGALLNSLGRHAFRPAHLHLKVSRERFDPLNTQVYFSGDRWLESDVADAVKGSLITKLERCTEPAELRKRDLDRPYFVVSYDFVLQPWAG